MTIDEQKNLGLFELGIENITDFTSTNPLVVKVNQIYDVSRKSLLSMYRWSFATQSVQITGTDLTDNKFTKEYELPTDYLRTEAVFSNLEETRIIRTYKVEFDRILDFADDIYLRYVADVDATKYPAYFSECFKYKFAMDLCFNLTGDEKLKESLGKSFLTAYVNAKNLDFRQYPSKPIKSKPYVEVRG